MRSILAFLRWHVLCIRLDTRNYWKASNTMAHPEIMLYTCVHDDGRFFAEIVREDYSPAGGETILYHSGFYATRPEAHCDAWQGAQLHAYSFEPCEFARTV
jgi:hypothetical protein